MTGPDDLQAVFETVRERVVPDEAERAALDEIVADLREDVRAAASDLPVETRVEHVGSTARDTWLSGDRDVDLFVCFPPGVEREALERYGLEVGRTVLPDGHAEYAEHPYVRGTREGYDVDLVPCFDVGTATEAQSAVDRTPFHNEYLLERLDPETADEVRLFKAFLVGVGAYGSNLRTRGFSGYLTELLVLEYGDAAATLEAIADWQPPVEIDPAGHDGATFEDPLVGIDPTDPGRNVAAVVVAENVARVQHHARALLAAPDAAVFEPRDPDPLDVAEVREHLRRREATPVALRFPVPDLVDDELYPQLRRSRQGVVGGLERAGFEVLRSAAWARETAVLFFELSVAERPAIERHEGPPVAVGEHAHRFYETYAEDDAVYGPFLDGERYVVERERECRTAAAFLRERLFDVSLGPAVADALEDDRELLVGEGVATLAGEFGPELARYFDPLP